MPEAGSSVEKELPSVSVVIPSHNGEARLLQTLLPLLGDPFAMEIIVVVNGSQDRSLELLEDVKRDEPRLKPFHLETPGASRARQVGVECASGEVVLLLDDDTVASPRLVSGHARWHAGRRGLVVLGYTPAVTPSRRRPGDFATFLQARDYERSYAAFESEPELVLRKLWGGNVSLRRSDCLRVGLHSERFRNRYHEDRDFGIRCLKVGLEGVFDRSLLAYHVHRRSPASLLTDARSQGAGTALVHRLHPDVLGPLPADAFEENLPAPARWVVRLCRRRVFRALALGLLWPAIRLMGILHMFRVETLLGQLLRRIELQYGALHDGREAADEA